MTADEHPVAAAGRSSHVTMLGMNEGLRASGAHMGAGYEYGATGGEKGQLRAADADRDRVAAFLTTAYVDGRLSKEEYDARLESTLSARTYGELDLVVADLPAATASRVTPAVNAVITPVTATNRLALASFACGLGQFVCPVTTIPAIVLGHLARGQIKRTGEQGAGLALAGLMLGWAALILGILVLAAVVALILTHPTTPPG